MKINLDSINRNQFAVREFDFHGEPLYLVNPLNPFDVDWDRDNLIFRSSIWNKEGELVSAGLPKFGNWGEKLDLWALPTNLVNCELIEKIDGSLLCISSYKGNQIVRTRGSYDATEKENGAEIEILKKQYPRVFNNTNVNSEKVSFLLEWVSPTNKIVCEYPEPDLYLIGAINHEGYRLISQDTLDMLAELYQVKRPARYNFGSISEMLAAIKAVKGKEGACLYAPDGKIFKIKSDWYLKRHSFKSSANINSIIELFCDWSYPTKSQFQDRLSSEIDFECSQFAEPLIDKVCQAWFEVLSLESQLETFVAPMRGLPRKEAAALIKKSEYPGLCFQILDGKVDKKTYKSLLIQFCKKI